MAQHQLKPFIAMNNCLFARLRRAARRARPLLFGLLLPALAHAAPPVVCPALAPDVLPANAAVWGTGTPASCTPAALQALLNAGGAIRVNGGSTPFTVVLTSTLTVPNQDVLLDGGNLLTLSGGGSTRIFDKLAAASAAADSRLALQHLTLRDGLALDNGSTDRFGGAAIRGRAYGRLRVIDVVFDNNTGPALQPDGCGAVHTIVYQSVVFGGCTFRNNRGANGGAVGTIGSAEEFVNCAFDDNAATGTGGTFDQGGIGGAVYVDGVNQNGVTNTMNLCGCTFQRNTAGKQGGAAALIFYSGQGSSAALDRCTFADNRVLPGGDLGGGLYYLSGPLALTNSTFARNSTPEAGGGAWLSNARLTLANCTFDANIATDGQGGGVGGGLALSGGTERRASVVNATFSGNRAGNFASAIFNMHILTLANSVFYNNPTGIGNQSNPYGGGTINKNSDLTVGAGNLQWPETYAAQFGPQREDWLTPAVTVADAQLQALANNGGPTPTQALPAGSPAINIGSAATAPPADQRGAARQGLPDAGAFEFGASAPLPVALAAFGARRTAPTAVLLTWRTATETANAGFRIERSADARTWAVVGYQPGAGSSAAPRAYQSPDEAAPAATTYYRLAQRDADGTATYSPVRAVAAAAAAGLQLVPNPASGPATQLLGADPLAPVQLYDGRGQLLHTFAPGTTALPIQDLPAGLYLVRVAGQRPARLLVPGK